MSFWTWGKSGSLNEIENCLCFDSCKIGHILKLRQASDVWKFVRNLFKSRKIGLLIWNLWNYAKPWKALLKEKDFQESSRSEITKNCDAFFAKAKSSKEVHLKRRVFSRFSSYILKNKMREFFSRKKREEW